MSSSLGKNGQRIENSRRTPNIKLDNAICIDCTCIMIDITCLSVRAAGKRIRYFKDAHARAVRATCIVCASDPRNHKLSNDGNNEKLAEREREREREREKRNNTSSMKDVGWKNTSELKRKTEL